jgi:hypothetical protein
MRYRESRLYQRMLGYRHLFTNKKLSKWQKIQSIFIPLSKAYKQTFLVEHDVYRDLVMADLRIFCRGTGSKWVEDKDKTLVMVGRNEVWERIISYAHITDGQIALFIEKPEIDNE